MLECSAVTEADDINKVLMFTARCSNVLFIMEVRELLLRLLMNVM